MSDNRGPSPVSTVSTEALKSLPNMQGAGNVRELQQAAALSVNVAGGVADVLARFQSAPTHAEQKALLDPLLTAWAGTSGMARSLEERAAGQYCIVYGAFDSEWNRKLHVLEAFNGQYFFNLPEKKSQTDGANWGLAILPWLRINCANDDAWRAVA